MKSDEKPGQAQKTCKVILPQDKSVEQTSAIIAVTTKIPTTTTQGTSLQPTPAQTPVAVLSKENAISKKSAEKTEATKGSKEKMSQEKAEERKPPVTLPVAKTLSSESAPLSKESTTPARSNEKLLPSKHTSAEKIRKKPSKKSEALNVGKKSAERTAPPRLSHERITKGSVEQMSRERVPLLPRKSA